jgi:hypothetical protein
LGLLCSPFAAQGCSYKVQVAVGFVRSL